jgi:hypothetical protein
MLLSIYKSHKAIGFKLLNTQFMAPSLAGFYLIPSRNFSKSRIHENFSFPKHDELFSHQNLDQEEDSFTLDDEQDKGVLRRYKPRRNINAKDIMQDDFNKVQQNMRQKVMDTYDFENLSEAQAMEQTRNITARFKMGRESILSEGQEFKKRRLQSEYLNHKKYQQNYTTREDVHEPETPGRDRLYVKNYRDAMKRLTILNSDREKHLDRESMKQAIKSNQNSLTNDAWLKDYEDKQKQLN